MSDSVTTIDERTGRVDAVLYGRVVELLQIAEARHSAALASRDRHPSGHELTFGLTPAEQWRAERHADGVAQGLAIALEALSGTAAGEHRARAIEAHTAAQRAGSERIREVRAQLSASAAQARREAAIDAVDDEGYANALAACRAAE